MSALGYFPGCSLGGTAAEYDHSLRVVASKLGVELAEVPDWVCCGASSAHAIDRTAALCLAADTLAKAAKAGLSQVLAPCAMCYQRLATASYEMKEHPELAKRLANALGENEALAKVEPLSVLKWLERMPPELVKQRVTRPLHGLKVACYYGCLLVRPEKITCECEVEAPRSMERMIEALGGQPVRWSMALECCGGSFAMSRTSVVLRQCKRIVDAARKAGAEAMCLACPMCHANLDLRQRQFVTGQETELPVLYLTQLMGLALGADKDELGLRAHFVPADAVVAKLA